MASEAEAEGVGRRPLRPRLVAEGAALPTRAPVGEEVEAEAAAMALPTPPHQEAVAAQARLRHQVVAEGLHPMVLVLGVSHYWEDHPFPHLTRRLFLRVRVGSLP